MEQYTFKTLMEASIIMPVMFVLSVIMGAFALERAWCFITAGRVAGRSMGRLRALIAASDVKSIKMFSASANNLLDEALVSILQAASRSAADAERVMKIKRQQVRAKLGKRLPVFGTFSNIAPLLGLLGTVMGIMRAFHDLSVSSSGGPSIIAAGISEALLTTIAGIAVAVVASVLNNYFISRIKVITTHIDVLGQEIILLVSPRPVPERDFLHTRREQEKECIR